MQRCPRRIAEHTPLVTLCAHGSLGLLSEAQERAPDSRGAVIEDIRASIKNGYGIVPLIGSGMSAASGIPAGRDYQAYLFYCLARVFGSDGQSKKRPPWNPRTLHWPEYTAVPKYDDVRAAMLAWSLALQQELDGASTPVRPHERYAADAKWQTSGAVADWRATLHLLHDCR